MSYFCIYLGLKKKERDLIKRAALLHDIGKARMPKEILLKPDKLTPREYEIMKSHPVVGAELLKNEPQEIVEAVRHHHERWDGKGYPDGLSGENIPLFARIISVVDAFDSMTSDRAYKKAMTIQEALAEVTSCSGTQFDPYLADVFVSIVDASLKHYS